MRISTKLGLGLGIAAAALIAVVAVAFMAVQHITENAVQLAELHGPQQEAIREMEINIHETASAVFDYLKDFEPLDKARVEDSEADFERFAEIFLALAENGEQRDLGVEVETLYGEFKIAGDELIALADEQQADILRLADVTAIDELIDEKLQQAIDKTAPGAVRKLELALEMKINIHEAFDAIRAHLVLPNPDLQTRLDDALADFRRFSSLYRSTEISAEETTWLGEIDSHFAAAADGGAGLIVRADWMRDRRAHMEEMLLDIDRLLDEALQPAVRDAMRAAEADAKDTAKSTTLLLLAIGLLGIAVAFGAGLYLTKSISGPIAKLARAAAEIGKGKLGTRVGIDSRDEVGMLARTVDRMAADLETTAVLSAHLDDILASMAESVIVAGLDRTIRTVNRTTLRLTGFTEKELIGQPVRRIVQGEPLKKGVLRDVLGGGTIENAEAGFRTKDGREIPVLLSAAPLRDVSGEVDGLVITALDITERKRIERERRQAQKMEAVGQLTGGVAHDFNNLLTVILGNLEMLDQDSKDDKRHRKWIQAASKASRRGADLTKRLLAFSRIQMLKPEVLSLNGLVSEMSELLHRTLGEAIEIETPLASDLWRVKVDRGQLENALLNLTINARDFMPRGGRLTIETANIRLGEEHAERYPDVAEGDYVMLAVTDSGLGMTREVAERAFDPFFTTKEAGKGSGLGLSMVYGFIKQSGGFTKIVSEPGRGTTVELYLPRAKPSEEHAAPEQPRRDEKYPTGDEAILLVEDDEAVREMTAEVLQSLGYRVLSAPNGPSALGVLDTHREIDLLFTDMVMPGGMNGVDLAREMRARGARLKVLYASGYANGAWTAGGPLDPSDKFIGKPFTKADLAREVRHALSG